MKNKVIAISLSKKLKELRKRRDKLDIQINEMNNELVECCPHDEVMSDESYVSGSYLDKEQYITTYYCGLCGVKLDKKIKYGGFG